MNVILSRSAVLLSVGTLFWFTGCQQPDHTMDETTMAAKPINCSLCYDRTLTVRKISPKGSWLGQRKTVVKHMCPECKVDSEIYTKDGKLMMQCAKCAPEGLACDKCLPPKSGT
jgi:hypothetical protein